MFIPAMPLQMVLAEQTARARALHREHELSGLIRAAWLGTFVIWLVAAGVVLLFQGSIMAQWHITNPVALWLTLPVLLFTVWLPMFYGVLQGQQNFLWMGWSMLIHGVGRVGVAAFAVLVLHYYAPGMMLGMLGGLAIALDDRHLADAVPLAFVPTAIRLAQPAPPDHPADAGIWGVPVYADGGHHAGQGLLQ